MNVTTPIQTDMTKAKGYAYAWDVASSSARDTGILSPVMAGQHFPAVTVVM